MKNGRLRRTLMTLTVVAGLFATGCTEQTIVDAARSSLTSFVTNVVNQGITAVLNP